MSVLKSPTKVACPFDQRQLERAFTPLLPGPVQLRVCDVFLGNINTIIKVEGNGRTYSLRVRTQESVYRYEPNLIKEAFVAWLLHHAVDGADDTVVAAAFADISVVQHGLVKQQSGILPALCYFDWSRQLLPYPYCIYEWVDGVPLWEAPVPAFYERAGETLARIHKIQLSAFYEDFLSVGTQPVSWSERFQAALRKELQAVKGRLNTMVSEQLLRLKIPEMNPSSPCLVHNDFAPGNIIVRDDIIAAIIDWDNSVIDVRHLDFVKMKYWTAKDAYGELTHHPVLFTAFVNGYGAIGQETVSSPLFRLYEVLWLLRVFNFERSKEEQGITRAPGYPAAIVYERFLDKVLDSV